MARRALLRSPLLLGALYLASCLLDVSTLFAAEITARKFSEFSTSQLHLRMGMVSGNFSGPVSGSFSVTNALDVEYEMFSGSKLSNLFRAIVAYDLSSQQAKYTYTGFGKRYYINSNTLSFESNSDQVNIQYRPRWRYYIGGDLGISHVLVKNFGDVLTVESTVLDFGLSAGTIYQMSPGFGLEANLGYTMGFGFTAVSVGATTLRILLGGVFHF